MNSNKIAEVRKLVEQSQQTGKRPNYGGEVKTRIRALLKDGISLYELASWTGISRGTLVNWVYKKQKNKFRKLKAVASPNSLPIQISLPSGVSIECSEVALIKNILEQFA